MENASSPRTAARIIKPWKIALLPAALLTLLVATFVIGHKSSKVAERDPALPLFLNELSAPSPPHRIAHPFSGLWIDPYGKAPMRIIHRPLDADPLSASQPILTPAANAAFPGAGH
jgi:hypothetical protein